MAAFQVVFYFNGPYVNDLRPRVSELDPEGCKICKGLNHHGESHVAYRLVEFISQVAFLFIWNKLPVQILIIGGIMDYKRKKIDSINSCHTFLATC